MFFFYNFIEDFYNLRYVNSIVKKVEVVFTRINLLLGSHVCSMALPQISALRRLSDRGYCK